MAKFNPKLLFLLGSAFCLADWGYPEVKEVVILERHSHDQFVRDFEVKVVQYSSSMCGHCKQFDHAYSRTALFFKDYHHRVPFASVDCSTNQEFCSDHLVPVYPFVKVYVRNHAITYFGPRTERALKKFVKHILGRNLKIVENTDMVSQARKSNIEGKLRPAILYFGTKTEKQFHMAELLCKVNNKLVCLYTPDTTLASQFGLNSHSKLVMLKTTGKNVIFKAQKFNFDMLEGFVFDNMHRRVHEIGNRFRKSVVNGGRDSLILFVQNILDPISKKFEKAVKAFRKDLPCFIASSDSGDQELVRKLVKALNIDTLPTILLAKHVHGMTFQRYTYKYSLESKHLRNFLENVWNKRLLPDLKSEPAPESNAGPIRKLVGAEFNKLVKAGGKTSVVLITQPNCQSSEQYRGVVEKVHSQLANDPDIQFFIMDGEKNEIQALSWSLLPLLVLFPKNTKAQPQIFEGKADVSALLDFIQASQSAQQPSVWNTDL